MLYCLIGYLFEVNWFLGTLKWSYLVLTIYSESLDALYCTYTSLVASITRPIGLCSHLWITLDRHNLLITLLVLKCLPNQWSVIPTQFVRNHGINAWIRSLACSSQLPVRLNLILGIRKFSWVQLSVLSILLLNWSSSPLNEFDLSVTKSLHWFAITSPCAGSMWNQEWIWLSSVPLLIKGCQVLLWRLLAVAHSLLWSDKILCSAN